jgi:hypothetical protein
MNDEELASLWTTLQPSGSARRRVDTRVFGWLDARETPLAREWIGLFGTGPFSAAALVAVSSVGVAAAAPLLWLVRLLM